MHELKTNKKDSKQWKSKIASAGSKIASAGSKMLWSPPNSIAFCENDANAAKSYAIEKTEVFAAIEGLNDPLVMGRILS